MLPYEGSFGHHWPTFGDDVGAAGAGYLIRSAETSGGSVVEPEQAHRDLLTEYLDHDGNALPRIVLQVLLYSNPLSGHLYFKGARTFVTAATLRGKSQPVYSTRGISSDRRLSTNPLGICNGSRQYYMQR